jgi:hypothetical protein
MKESLALAAVLEAATGLALMIAPATVALLLLGNELSGASMALGHVAGFALFSLGLACWPGRDAPRVVSPAFRAMLTYNLLTTVYLLYLGSGGEWVGRLLWPAVAIHAVVTVFLCCSWFKQRHSEEPTIGDKKTP